jgi:ribosomal protein S18 acetylase RimI-like enzyme
VRARSGSELRHALPDCPAEVRGLIGELVDGVTEALEESVVGIYLHGSLVFGDFRPETSDLDLIVVLRSDVDDRQLERLGAIHDAIAQRHPTWHDRIDHVYVSTTALQSFRERESPLVVISPGEPLHRTRTSPGWVMNWHLLQEHGVALVGPPPRSVVATTTHDDFEAAVRTYLPELADRAERTDRAAARAYCVLTICRGLHTCLAGRHVSKTDAARWAARRYPEWAGVIETALERRLGRDPTEPERAGQIAFVRFGLDLLEGPGPQITLRRATADDLEFLFTLLEAALGPYVEQTYGPWREDDQRRRFFATTRPETHEVVELGGRSIGCLKVERQTEQIKLQRVFLLPEHQSRGIGERLVRDLLDEARSAELPVRLRVFKVNQRAQRFYRRLGFSVTGETDTHVLMKHAARR